MNLFRAPASELGAAVEEDFHEADHLRVMDFDSWKLGRSNADRQGQPLQERKLDMHV